MEQAVQSKQRGPNPTKCIWAHFRWINFLNGILMMAETKKETSIQITILQFGAEAQQVPKLNPTTANRYLGVQMTMNGNCTKELKILKGHNKKFTQMLIHSHFTCQETCTIYRQCYLPTVTYLLPATTMPVDQIQKSQKQVTTAFLLKMGYPQTSPMW